MNRKASPGFTIIEIMFTLALLGAGLLFFLYILHHITMAQVEVRDRLREMAAAEAIAEQIMAYTGSNASLKAIFDPDPDTRPDVRIEEKNAEIVRVVITKTFRSITPEYLSVQLTFLRYNPPPPP